MKRKPPQLHPYVFTGLLLFFGLWCLYDGWLNTDPEMAEHALFNQVLSVVLVPWGIYDFVKTRKFLRKEKQAAEAERG